MERGQLKAGVVLSPYVLHAKLGEGAMGDVWRAEHRTLRKPVAIKVLKPEHANNDNLRGRFLREGEASVRVRHPNVVEVYDVGEWEGVPYLVMELLEGESLADKLEREGALPPDEIAALMLPVLAAVSAAHEVGVVHRDLKPENIFLARAHDGGIVPKVLDFGISRIVDDRSGRVQTLTDALLGTPPYMSPEQARGEAVIDDRSDQYGLGAVLYEAATGTSAFGDAPIYALLDRVTKGAFARPRDVRPEIPERFEALVLRAMALDARQRFRSVRSMGASLLPFADAHLRATWSAVFDPTAVARREATLVDGPIARWSSSTAPPETPRRETVAPSAIVARSASTRDARAQATVVLSRSVPMTPRTIVVSLVATLLIAALVALALLRG